MDTLPAQKQEIGNAWAGRMVASGHLIGYTMYLNLPPARANVRGFANLTKIFFFIGDTQLKIICFLSAIGLFVSVGITCYAVSERVLIKRGFNRTSTAILKIAFNLGSHLQLFLSWCLYGTP